MQLELKIKILWYLNIVQILAQITFQTAYKPIKSLKFINFFKLEDKLFQTIIQNYYQTFVF